MDSCQLPAHNCSREPVILLQGRAVSLRCWNPSSSAGKCQGRGLPPPLNTPSIFSSKSDCLRWLLVYLCCRLPIFWLLCETVMMCGSTVGTFCRNTNTWRDIWLKSYSIWLETPCGNLRCYVMHIGKVLNSYYFVFQQMENLVPIEPKQGPA